MSKSSNIRVMVVDDHDMARAGISTVVSAFDEFELVAEAADGAEAIEICEQVQPDVILMDMMMPVMGGVEATRAIRHVNHDVRIIAVSNSQEADLVQAALSAGADAYLTKDISVDELVSAIIHTRRN